MSDIRQLKVDDPAYWSSLRGAAVKPDRRSWKPIILEQMTVVDSTDCASARWYLNQARNFGWAVRATRARHLQPPAVSGNYSGRWAEYTTIAVRLLHRKRGISAWGTWQYDSEGNKGKGAWSYETAMWAIVLDWDDDGRRPGRIAIVKAYDGGYRLAADELKAIVKGEAFTPPKKDQGEGTDAKPRKPRKAAAPKRVLA